MLKLKEILNSLLLETFAQTYQFINWFLPKMILSLVIIIVGWICAVIIKKVISKFLKSFGFDVISEKTGLQSLLEKGGIKKDPSSIVGLAFYWMVLFSALVMVFNTLQLEVVKSLLEKTVLYIPNIIVSLILIAVGMFLGKFIKEFVASTSKLANIPFHDTLGQGANIAIVGLSIMMALEQLNVAASIINQAFLVLFGILPIMLFLTCIIAGRDLISNLLTGRFLINEYIKGDNVEFESITGKIESVDLLTTKIKEGNKEIIIPNSDMAKKVVKRILLDKSNEPDLHQIS